MKILLTGGTGFIGKPLREQLIAHEHELVVLTRATKRKGFDRLKYITWDWREPPDLTELISKTDIVINLAGEPIAKERWTKEQKERLLKSRIIPTKVIVDAINNSPKKPKKFISASAIGIYGNRFDEEITESSSLGNDFLSSVCKEWEKEAQKAQTNVTILRIGIVLGKDGGALEKIIPPFKSFVGGPFGSGNQYMSWIALDDVVGLIKFACDNEKVSGIINAVSPNPVTNKEFSNTLGNILHRPSFMPAPAFVLRLMLGEMSDLLLTGQKVIPEMAIKFDYKFKYPDLEKTLERYIKWRICTY